MRKVFRFAFLLGSLPFFFTACTSEEKSATVDMDKARTEIQAMEDAYAAAEKNKDAEAVAAYYHDNAISYMRDEQPASGKAAIKAAIEKRIAEDSTNNANVYKVVDIFAEGDLLVEIGSWKENDSTGAEVKNGHYMSVFKKENGKYLCIRDMSVSSTPSKK